MHELSFANQWNYNTEHRRTSHRFAMFYIAKHRTQQIWCKTMLPFLSSRRVKDSQEMNSLKAIALPRHLCLHVKVNFAVFSCYFWYQSVEPCVVLNLVSPRVLCGAWETYSEVFLSVICVLRFVSFTLIYFFLIMNLSCFTCPHQ